MDAVAEERQRLLAEEGGRGSDEELKQPPLLPPRPAPLQSIPLQSVPLVPPPPPPPPFYPTDEAPPSYMDLPPYSQVVGIPVQLQVDGKTVSATLLQEPSGKHIVCINEPSQDDQNPNPGPPKDFLFLSLIGLICCFPLAVVALLRTLEVHRLYRQGDYLGALKASRQAQSWGTAAVIFGLCVFVLPMVMRLYFLHSHQSYHHYYDY